MAYPSKTARKRRRKRRKKTSTEQKSESREIWTKEHAKEWYGKKDWIVGADFLPSTAINQLEMFQEASFDTATINKELGWAEGIGMNTMRVLPS